MSLVGTTIVSTAASLPALMHIHCSVAAAQVGHIDKVSAANDARGSAQSCGSDWCVCIPAEHSSLWPTSATSMCQFIWNGLPPTFSGLMLQSQDSPWPCPCAVLSLLQLQAPEMPLKQLLLLLMLQLQQQLLFCLMWKTQRAAPSMSRIWRSPQVRFLFLASFQFFLELHDCQFC